MIRSSRERNRSCSPVSCRSRGRIAHPPSIISRARNHSLRFEGIAKTICKKTAAPPLNSGKSHYLERLNHPSRSTPWKYFTGDCLVCALLGGRGVHLDGPEDVTVVVCSAF